MNTLPLLLPGPFALKPPPGKQEHKDLERAPCRSSEEEEETLEEMGGAGVRARWDSERWPQGIALSSCPVSAPASHPLLPVSPCVPPSIPRSPVPCPLPHSTCCSRTYASARQGHRLRSPQCVHNTLQLALPHLLGATGLGLCLHHTTRHTFHTSSHPETGQVPTLVYTSHQTEADTGTHPDTDSIQGVSYASPHKHTGHCHAGMVLSRCLRWTGSETH